MVEVQRIRNGPQSPTQEEELEARRILLAGARKGDRKAKSELMKSYGVKIYSEAERKKTKVVALPTPSKEKALERSRSVPQVVSGFSAGSRKTGRKSP
jgi:hypothetical protein